MIMDVTTLNRLLLERLSARSARAEGLAEIDDDPAHLGRFVDTFAIHK
jgi:hypothetical protein